MPRGRKPPRHKKPTQAAQLQSFAGRIEQATPQWLDDYERRRAVLQARFDEVDDEGKWAATIAEMAMLHRQITASEAKLMEFINIRERLALEQGVSRFMDHGGTTNNLTLNFAPGMSAEQRAMMERMYLASVSGKEVEALPAPKVIEASVA